LVACKSAPAATEEKPYIEEAVADDFLELMSPETEEIHEPSAGISQALYDHTLAEVKQFIDTLNKAIAAKNYNDWKSTLSDEYFELISSPEYLAKASDAPVLKTRKIVLKSPNDYFLYVVIPSRANSKVDEIEFVTENRVKVFHRETRTRKDENNVTQTEVRYLRLYELIKIDDKWKIVN
jgi:hypothetical protein